MKSQLDFGSGCWLNGLLDFILRVN
uniref:Uncharacterized protein n=1 Tax=Rhizophora mucronata TaxID=61149 RepID=A0A2P2PNL2_RHIMU